MKSWMWLGVALLLAPALALAGDDKKDAGKEVYAKKCASCHGPNGEGNEKIAKMLKVEIRPLGSKPVQAKSDEELRKNTVEGVGKMKPVKGLTDQQLADLLAHLRTLKEK